MGDKMKRKRVWHRTEWLDDNTCCDGSCTEEAMKMCPIDGLVFCEKHAKKHEATVYSYKRVSK
jgi:hypothetical protein